MGVSDPSPLQVGGGIPTPSSLRRTRVETCGPFNPQTVLAFSGKLALCAYSVGWPCTYVAIASRALALTQTSPPLPSGTRKKKMWVMFLLFFSHTLALAANIVPVSTLMSNIKPILHSRPERSVCTSYAREPHPRSGGSFFFLQEKNPHLKALAYILGTTIDFSSRFSFQESPHLSAQAFKFATTKPS